MDDHERRRARVHLVDRRRVGPQVRAFVGVALHDDRGEEHRLGVGGPHAVAVGEVVDAVERDGRDDRGVGAFEAGLVALLVRGQRRQRGEVPAGRAAGDGDEAGVGAELVGVVTDPGDGPLHVDEVVGEGRGGAEPVVDVAAHPPAGGHLTHEQLPLALLEPEHPATAVDLDQDGPTREATVGDIGAVGDVWTQDVHAQGPAAGPGELDPPLPAHRQRIGPVDLDDVAQGLADLVTGPEALADGRRHADAGPQGEDHPGPARRGAQRPTLDEPGAEQHLDGQDEGRQLDGDPAGEEAPAEQEPEPVARPEGVEGVERVVDRHGQEAPARPLLRPRVSCRRSSHLPSLPGGAPDGHPT